ncbi:dihydroxyacetone kinase subunit DhaK [Curtobacterium sp. Leaf261]|uniref:dihydroxyacetone kinase subunit DhaK n=1 Tax=Curtobacterium sp. Leaf261 TaxID=1736311 RepID=UPI0006FB17C8|nr:dihydroxyacetone kinase subunit DhaK [Curtobacterium sp. Leaf261]KQO64838.1 dihydroxyacetone kinase [Curtobacterium sp. Leaf261]
MKKLINDPRQVVDETVRGFAIAHARQVVLQEVPIHLRRIDAPVAGKVAIVSGGGSGHEPLHAGFIGHGMLDAAVPGPMFTSPTPDPIVDTTKAVDGGAGVLYIVKNYTGDVLNFETAAELAGMDDIRVESVLVDDDVAVQDSLYTAGRRGVAGTLVVEKCAGAAAERGDDLSAVAAVARHAVDVTRSMGLALAPCTVPHAGEPSFSLADDEVELGVGIHGEPGREKIAMAPADELVDRVIEPILADLDAPAGSRVLLLVNGMGGTPLSELYIVFRRAAEILADRGLELSRSLVGNYVTSLEMQGFSLTVTVLDDDLTTLWDAPVETPALRWGR